MTGASMAPAPHDPESAAVQADFPGWTIWSSDRGHWYATRRERLPVQAGRWRLWPTVHSPDLHDLRAELDEQEQRAELALALDALA